ncbi:response regulator, partial [Actinomyces sp. 187325]
MTQVLLISDDQACTRAVAAVITELEGFAELIAVSSPSQARIEVGRQDIDIVLVDEALDGGNGPSVLREMSSVHPLLPVCLLSPRTDADLVLRTVDAGGRGVLPLPPTVGHYAERLSALSAWTRAARGLVSGEREQMSRSVGSVIAVIGAKGGVGTSLIALATARDAAARDRAALVDLDLRAGDLAAYCGVTVRNSVTDLAALAAEVGGREISEVAYPLHQGIDLLPAPERTELAEIMNEAAARQIIQAMRYRYACVVVDCGSHLDDATAAAIDLADQVVIVATPQVPALRCVRRLTEAMNRLDLARGTEPVLVLNRTSRHNEIQPAAAARLVSLNLLAVLPERTAQLEPVLNTGTLIDLALPELTAVGAAVAGAASATRAPAVAADPALVADETRSPERPSRRRGRRARQAASRRSRATGGGEDTVSSTATGAAPAPAHVPAPVPAPAGSAPYSPEQPAAPAPAPPAEWVGPPSIP